MLTFTYFAFFNELPRLKWAPLLNEHRFWEVEN